ncbi:MAG: hypothetical protein Q9163_002634 [Psora crenata]
MNGTPTHRPLAEIGPMERRRNSPSYNQATRVSILISHVIGCRACADNRKKPMVNQDSSPFDCSPHAQNSPRLYWQNRDPGSPTKGNAENRDPQRDRDYSPSPAKRSSIENLKRASRVKNSNMFAREQKQEYDPTSSPFIERPLATGRPLSVQVQGNAFGGRGLEGFRKENATEAKFSPLRSPFKTTDMIGSVKASSKGQASPTKSSLSSKSRYVPAEAYGTVNEIWSDEEDSINERQLPPGKSLHRHAKSVTFDAAPPQVNEYEMTTPDPSSVASGSRDGSHDSVEDEEDESFDRGSSLDRDDSFDASLEDIEKTPVVLPEDWRFMSPSVAKDDLTALVEDPFQENRRSSTPNARPSSAGEARPSPTRSDSAASNGERRPLPPLPPFMISKDSQGFSDSKNSTMTTAERVDHSQRSPASPPLPASVSKSEIQGMGGCSMPIEERLKLMVDEDIVKQKTQAEEQRERRLRRGSPFRSPDSQSSQQRVGTNEDEMENEIVADMCDYKMPPRISRESILRKVKGRAKDSEFEEEDSSFLLSSRFSKDISDIDPDTPLPSTEYLEEQEVEIKQEPVDEENEVDVYSIPDLYSQQLQAESFTSAMEKLEIVKQSREASSQRDDDDESHYSMDSEEGTFPSEPMTNLVEDEGPPTPRATICEDRRAQIERNKTHRMSLPQFAALLGEQDFDFGMESFMTDTQPERQETVEPAIHAEPSGVPSPLLTQAPSQEKPSNPVELERAVTPEAQLGQPRFSGQGRSSVEEPQTPESVIRHPIKEPSAPESPSIPEPVATIKASGSRLKTRPSATPADLHAMAEVRRQVSSELPAIETNPQQHQSRSSVVWEADQTLADAARESASMEDSDENDSFRKPKRKSSLVPLDIVVEGSDSLGIESEFDRLIEAQKVECTISDSNLTSLPWSPGYTDYTVGQGFRPVKDRYANSVVRTQKGYLMRQNTKVIVASSASIESTSSLTKEEQDPARRGTRSTGSSPRKASHLQTWTMEPWNGNARRKSIRKSGGIAGKATVSGPVPPLPGMQSNVAGGLANGNGDSITSNTDEIGEDGERGRLFVKVVRVKDLDLPLPRGERSYFALTLDNGLHCVTTSWLELGKTAPIGQEFELVVLNDLEFQLTLQTKLEEPRAKPVVESPTKSIKAAKSSTFSRVFASPRKRKEMEVKQQEDAQRADRQRQQDAQASRRAAQPTAWELLHKLVARDGCFARSYVCLKDHESSAYGKPYTVDVPCFNEWATEEDHNGSSARSKRSTHNGGVQRRAPYRIGKLELQLLYVPKPKAAKDEDMPKSMNACIRELKEAEMVGPTKWEGNLSQQGGDCPYWRRRFFTLEGSKFTAYHEVTRQPRATINLAKASKLIDDKSALMRSGKGNRRKSAFAEDEEGYMFVEEGFRIRFANGETIDFYADSAAEKDGWMKVLAEVVGKDIGKNIRWTDIVLAKQRAQASTTQRPHEGKVGAISPTKPAPLPPKSAPPTPSKTFQPRKPVLPVPEKNPRRSDVAFANRRADAAAKTRSMIF